MRKVLLTIAVIATCIPVMAQWTDNTDENNRITPVDMKLYHTDFRVTPQGITYYVINRPLNGKVATSLQIIKKDGTLTFPEEGKTISNEITKTYTVINDVVMADRDNNALISVQDCRNSNASQLKQSYTIYKVSPAGENLWGENGIDLEEGRSNNIQAAMRMLQLEDGSYIFAWMWTDDESIMNIKLQKRSDSGELIWTEELKDNQVSYQYPYLANAGNNQFYLVYAKGSNLDIMVRKFDFDGATVWPEDTRVYRGGFPTVPLHVILKVANDPNGGVFIGWYDDRGFTNKESTFVSYVKPDGSLGFSKGEEGERVGYSDYRSFSPEMKYDQTENCLYVLWRETSPSQTNQRIMAQKMALSGELKWGAEGIEVAPLSEKGASYYTLQSAAPGEIAAFYMLNETLGYADVKAYASRIDKDGKTLWESPAMFTGRPAMRSSLVSSPLIENGYWLTLWNDERKLTEDPEEVKVGKTYMQKINIDGTYTTTSVNSPRAETPFSICPSVVNDQATFSFTTENTGAASLTLYNLSGQIVSTVFQGELEKGTHEITWNAKSDLLQSGIYIATLKTGDLSRTIRLIVK